MNYIELIGFAAACFTTFAFLPQAVKIYKSKSTSDISFFTFFVTTLGVLLWLIYGILIVSYPLIFWNSISFTLSLFILVYKIRYG